MASSRPSCHGRWCFPQPNTTQCQNVTAFVESQQFSSNLDAMMKACCAIYCDNNRTSNSHPFLALECQGASHAGAISIWTSVIAVVLLSFLHLLGGMLPGSSQAYTTMGSLAVKAGLASYFLVTFSDQNVDTMLYPIVAAMDFAIVSFFFSGFQYSIGIGFEAASVLLLTYTVFPLYQILLEPPLLMALMNGDLTSDPLENAARAEALTMLVLALLWALHSAMYRTISYRAHWIEAWKNQTKPAMGGPDNAHMSKLWYLAAGHGHPTWHTPVGRSVGLLLLILSWTIVVQSNIFLKKTCVDDFVLFQIMLYVPPILLVLAILSTEIYLLRFASDSWHFLKHFILLRGPSQADFLEATVAYRLGRNTLFVENIAERDESLNLLKGIFDPFVGRVVFYLEYGLRVLLYIPIAITAASNFCLIWSLRRLQIHGFRRKLGLDFSQRVIEEIQINNAYKILVKYTGVDGLPTHPHQTREQKLEFIEKALDKHQKCINLPLLLDEIGPSSLMCLLKILDEKLFSSTELKPPSVYGQPINAYI